MFSRLREDLASVRERDPAARSTWEVLTCYPGVHALMVHRLAHGAWVRGFHWLGRFISHVGRFLTGIEIHPGATIGRRVFIDHGMGVVIGETAEVGNDVTLYQGVTLGGVSGDPGKRHPTLEDGVVVGAGAAVLGPFTVGRGARIGSNAVVLQAVEPNTTVVGVPAHAAARRPVTLRQRHFPAYGNEPGITVDPVLLAIEELCARVEQLENELAGVSRPTPEAEADRLQMAEPRR